MKPDPDRCATCGYAKARCKGHTKTATSKAGGQRAAARKTAAQLLDASDLLSTKFRIDPADPHYEGLRSACEPGSIYRCLINTVGTALLHKRMTTRLDHDRGTGVIGLTHGGYRWERAMTPAEIAGATAFDRNEPVKPFDVVINLADPSWTARPKQHTPKRGGTKTAANNNGRGPDNPVIKTVRERQRLALAQAAKAGELG